MQNNNVLFNINKAHPHTSKLKGSSHYSSLYRESVFTTNVTLIQVDRETELLEITSQLNQLLLKMIHWFEALESLTPAAQNSVNAMTEKTQTYIMTT